MKTLIVLGNLLFNKFELVSIEPDIPTSWAFTKPHEFFKVWEFVFAPWAFSGDWIFWLGEIIPTTAFWAE